jgi:hypothetical protein
VPECDEILTNRGFVTLDAYKARAALDDELRVAGYDAARAQMLFEVPCALVENARRSHDMIELVCGDDKHDSGVSMLVTKQHNLFAACGRSNTFAKVPAVKAMRHSAVRQVRVRCVRMRVILCTQLTVAANGVRVDATTSAAFDAIATKLHLDAPIAIDAFLAVYGAWLCGGVLRRDGAMMLASSAIATSLRALGLACDTGGNAIADHSYARCASGVLVRSEALRRVLACESACAEWVWSLHASQLRALLRGACGCDDSTRRREIRVTSVRLRDELVRVCLLAGFTADFAVLADGGAWLVCVDDAMSACARPVLSKQRGEMRQRAYTGRTWCFTMPSGFVWCVCDCISRRG